MRKKKNIFQLIGKGKKNCFPNFILEEVKNILNVVNLLLSHSREIQKVGRRTNLSTFPQIKKDTSF